MPIVEAEYSTTKSRLHHFASCQSLSHLDFRLLFCIGGGGSRIYDYIDPSPKRRRARVGCLHFGGFGVFRHILLSGDVIHGYQLRLCYGRTDVQAGLVCTKAGWVQMDGKRGGVCLYMACS